MQIVIPMSGKGERFLRAGYKSPKPLIEVNGKPLIGHILDLFPGEDNVIFICNEEHLETTNMRETLKKYCPQGEIISIRPHKLGPVFAVSKAFNYIDDNLPTIVNYCDFSCYWDYRKLKNWLRECNPDGCIPAYRGFHPHSLSGNNYAFMKVKDGWMQEIQEKKAYTSNKMQEYASSGTYYFSKGGLLKNYFSEAISKNMLVNNEYYCSVVYNLMVKAGLCVAVYELQHFMQWGTPEDLKEYLRWSNTFEAIISKKTSRKIIFKGTTLVSMAGKGSRFSKEGYKIPKPLIEVNGQPMFIQSAKSLPKSSRYHFVALKDSNISDRADIISQDLFKKTEFTLLNEISEGQACSCFAALEKIPLNEPLTISACDHGVIFNEEKLLHLFDNKDIDIIIWVNRGHPDAIRRPESYGWVNLNSNHIKSVLVKECPNNPSSDPLIIGTFTFKKAEIFKNCYERLLARNGKVNNEFYIDSCINDAISMGYKCQIFEVDHFLCWGTPQDLKCFEYWQSCFHKWHSHPYSFGKDIFNDKSLSKLPDYLYSKNYKLPSRLGNIS